ncbi:hypothetical protein WG66_003286 [Moniliophthora roreri]|nr:hypothetical protein WG66_003286 [Moniliophthora roreri]
MPEENFCTRHVKPLALLLGTLDLSLILECSARLLLALKASCEFGAYLAHDDSEYTYKSLMSRDSDVRSYSEDSQEQVEFPVFIYLIINLGMSCSGGGGDFGVYGQWSVMG